MDTTSHAIRFAFRSLAKVEGDRDMCHASKVKVLRVSSLKMLEQSLERGKKSVEFKQVSALFEKAFSKLMEVASASPCGAVFQVVRAESFVNGARRLKVLEIEEEQRLLFINAASNTTTYNQIEAYQITLWTTVSLTGELQRVKERELWGNF